MISQLINDFINTYESFRGTGKILVLFVLSFLFLYLTRDGISFNPVSLLLSPTALISSSATAVIKKTKTRISRIFVIFLSGLIIIMSGQCMYSREKITPAENSYHIPDGYVAVMDYLLADDQNPSVLAMPEYSLYHTMYSSRFTMLYEQHENADIRYLSKAARDAYTQLSDSSPDMKVVAEAADSADIEYIVLSTNHYWPEFPLDRFGYPLYATLDGWEIYKRGGE